MAFLIFRKRQRLQPHRYFAGEGATGARAPTPQPFNGAVTRPNEVAFRRPRSAIFRSPLRAFETFLPWEEPRGVLGWQDEVLEPRFSSDAYASSAIAGTRR